MASGGRTWAFVFANGTMVVQGKLPDQFEELNAEGGIKFRWKRVSGSPPAVVELRDEGRRLSMRIETARAVLRPDGGEWAEFNQTEGGSHGSWRNIKRGGDALVTSGAEQQPTAFKFDCGGGVLASASVSSVVWSEFDACGSPKPFRFHQLSAQRVSEGNWELLLHDQERGCCMRLVAGSAGLFWPPKAAGGAAHTVLAASDFQSFAPRHGCSSTGRFVSTESAPSVALLLGQSPDLAERLEPIERPAISWTFACQPETYLSIYARDPTAATRNPFRDRALRLQHDPEAAAPLLTVPAMADVRGSLPAPHWPANPAAIACYWRVWDLAFRNLTARKVPDSVTSRSRVVGIPFPFADTAFSDCLFMWDSVFILSFARYGRRACDLWQGTMDNFYATALQDGFISKELRMSGHFQYHPHDPCSTGPNVLAWSEWDHYRATGDLDRLADVFWPLVAYHRWTRSNRTWQNGTYWSTGLGCGMDNIPRADREVTLNQDLFADPGPDDAGPAAAARPAAAPAAAAAAAAAPSAAAGGAAAAAGAASAVAHAGPTGAHDVCSDVTLNCPWLSHGHLSWVDATAQALLSAECIIAIAGELHAKRPSAGVSPALLPDMHSECGRLMAWLQERSWDPRTALFHDVDAHGRRTPVMHVGGFWPLVAGAATAGTARQLHRAGTTPLAPPDAPSVGTTASLLRAATAGAAKSHAAGAGLHDSHSDTAEADSVPKPPPVVPAPCPRPRSFRAASRPGGRIVSPTAAQTAAAAAAEMASALATPPLGPTPSGVVPIPPPDSPLGSPAASTPASSAAAAHRSPTFAPLPSSAAPAAGPRSRAAVPANRSDSDVGIGTALLRDAELLAAASAPSSATQSPGASGAPDPEAATSAAATCRPALRQAAPVPLAGLNMPASQVLSLPSARRMAELLHDPAAFGTPTAVPSLVASDRCFDPTGGYWRGGVWSPTTYMVLRGLRRAGLSADEHAVALRHCRAVWEAFEATGTVHENYSPVAATAGRPAKGDFVGWSGLGPVAILIESVFGITADWPSRTVVWVVHLTDEFGVDKLPLGTSDHASFRCRARSSVTDGPSITVQSSCEFTLVVRWPAGEAPCAGERIRTVRVVKGENAVTCD
ncbi:hypothetical protein FNF31_02593 [Cafeteria roenbergensis]|uniref:Mannosylglycerate hydrolase MGH1-like glycoside hydrolase domain-containing protein n=1 Tax=Cafeteria roenbergensis TaxID=33653 RepID=A0A5A8DHE2_CAFRO|nr:hypothetical protein FNF31_02593 [Cafeteria roenbergensis]